MNKILISLLVFQLSISSLIAQQNISLENIWQDYTFTAKRIPGFTFQEDGRHYTRLVAGQVVQYDLLSGEQTKVLLDASALEGKSGFSGKINSYSFNSDESKMLLTTDEEAIYRRSRKANYYVWDGENLTQLFDKGKQMYATFNKQSDKVAFVFENNLYVRDLKKGSLTQVTTDGKINEIINGATDWVYEEEFGFAQAFEWSPDGKSIAYYRFDEREVKEFIMTNYKGGLYPEYVRFKYPKVGEKNSDVSIHIYNLKKKKSVQVDLGTEKDQYVPRIKWTKDPKKLCVYRLNRHQNHIELLLANAKKGTTETLLERKNKWYIEDGAFDNLYFLKNGEFVWTSEESGFNHVYLYDKNGKQKKQLTSGDWDVDHFYGVDDENGKIYFQAAAKSPMEREIYVAKLNGKKAKKLTKEKGWNAAQFSSTFDFYVNTFSTINTPPTYKVYDRNGKLIRVIEDNKNLADLKKTYNVSDAEFFQFTTDENVTLNGYTIKPPNFSKKKEYPVFMYQYGGPGSQQVVDNWRGQNYWWFQMLAQQGFIVAVVDNRGTGGRGEEFKKMTYQQLGHFETIDQIAAAKYLGSLKYTDPNRIGIFGWSYGGYMSTNCLLKGNDVFKAAIAVAPVTNWKWYDTIYTERFMRTEKENPSGYFDNSPVNFADRLKGNYFLAHGMGDDNVHFQHTAEMANALINANKQFVNYAYPNRNHGIYGGNTRLHLYQAMTDFLDEHLMNDDSPVGEDLNRP